MRMCMGARRGFICRMRIGNMPVDPLGAASHTVRLRQRHMLGPGRDGHHYAVVHVTGYVKNWPSHGSAHGAAAAAAAAAVGDEDAGGSASGSAHQCLVAIGRLQVTSQPNTADLSPHSQHEFITRHSCDSKISFCDQRLLLLSVVRADLAIILFLVRVAELLTCLGINRKNSWAKTFLTLYSRKITCT